MLSLYYNVKLTEKKIRTLNPSFFSDFFHPGYFPVNFDTMSISMIDQCLLSIKSLSSLKFNYAIFNILIDIDDNEQKKSSYEKIKNIIEKKINTKNLVFNYSRPSTKNEWIKDINLQEISFKDDPVLIMMNHDHIMQSNYINFFLNDIKICFLEKKYNRVMSYSHCPEVLANSNKSESKIGIRIFKKKINWIDSIYLMRINTLKLFFERLVVPHENFYLGRIDWEGTYIKSTTVEFYNCDKPYFYHLGLYSHITGINLQQFFKSNHEYIYLNGKNIGNAYCEWLMHYHLYLFRCFKKNKDPVFIKDEIYKTLEHYLSYAKCDGISMSAIEKEGLLALVYSTFNSTYNLFEIENNTAKKNFLSMIKKLLPKPMKFIFKKFFLIKNK
jgi:hypothetical protein